MLEQNCSCKIIEYDYSVYSLGYCTEIRKNTERVLILKQILTLNKNSFSVLVGFIGDTTEYCEPALKMEPAAEDNSDNLIPWSGSDGSQEVCATESLADSYCDNDASDAEYPLDPPPARKSPEHYQPHDWETTGDQQSLPELSGSEEDASYREEDDTYRSGSRELTTESPGVQTPPTSLSPHSEYPDPEQPVGQRSQPHSHSSSSSLGCAADMTLALTLTTDQPKRASNRQGPEILNMGVESSEEGGSSEAPPASVSFGILDEGAEQAEKWNSESDTDLYRPISNRARCTRKYPSPTLTFYTAAQLVL